MLFKFKKLMFAILFNFSLFLMLIIGIQNSRNNSRVNFLNLKSVNLPISFIIGTSFISGSLIGSVLKLKYNEINKINT